MAAWEKWKAQWGTRDSGGWKVGVAPRMASSTGPRTDVTVLCGRDLSGPGSVPAKGNCDELIWIQVAGVRRMDEVLGKGRWTGWRHGLARLLAPPFRIHTTSQRSQPLKGLCVCYIFLLLRNGNGHVRFSTLSAKQHQQLN